MAEHQEQQQYILQRRHEGGVEGIKSILPENGPTTSQVLAVVTLLPVGGTFLALSGLTLAGTLIGFLVTTPLFVIFSPVLVPAALVIGLALLGFLTSGALGITALSSLSWMVNYFRKMPQHLEQPKRKAQETTMAQAGLRAREMGHAVQSKAQELTKGGQ